MRAFLLGLCLLGCANGSELQQACTLIGCNDGLNVIVVSSLQQDHSVTVKSGTQTLRTFTCQAGQQCLSFIERQTPTNITVQVATNSGTISRDYKPQYAVSRPNGPGCDPECRQATVTVNVN